MRFDGRTGLVTGVDAPFGAAVARALAGAGARVRVGSSDLAATQALAGEIGAEVASPDTIADGPLDLLVEATPLPNLAATLADAATVEEALAAAARPVLRLLGAVGRLAPGGAALLLTVTPGPTPSAGWIGPVLAFREAVVAELARDLAPRALRVNGLAPVADGAAKLPGFLKKGAKAPPTTPLGRVATPDEAAEAALWLLSAGMATGLTLRLDGGRGL